MTTSEQTLRKLALKAAGMTGADVAYAVRQARRHARRQNRSITFDDIQSQLDAGKPTHTRRTLLRMAIHEAGHGVAALCIGVETISMITIRGPHGNAYLAWSPGGRGLMTEHQLMGSMVVLLAGRATEDVHCRVMTSGSGGDAVIPPFLTGLCSRIHAAIFSFCAGVMPPMPMLGRSLLVHSHCVANACASSMLSMMFCSSQSWGFDLAEVASLATSDDPRWQKCTEGAIILAGDHPHEIARKLAAGEVLKPMAAIAHDKPGWVTGPRDPP